MKKTLCLFILILLIIYNIEGAVSHNSGGIALSDDSSAIDMNPAGIGVAREFNAEFNLSIQKIAGKPHFKEMSLLLY
ncbi:MAG: hypothetical protein KAS39_01015, partial [Actinomycetia bacterium]|nr:hypothetical protein [Actinomycetes bacterium]